MQADTVKLWWTYLIATVVVAGGGVMLYLTRLDPQPGLSLVVAGFIGSALTFVFGAESATRASRASERAVELVAAKPAESALPPPNPSLMGTVQRGAADEPPA